MFNSMGQTNPEDLGNGGTIDGDVIITGDLQVNGGGSLSFDEVIEGTQVIDVTSTEALLVRKNSDGGDVFTVDTTNSEVELGVGVNLKVKYSSYSGQLGLNSNGYTELQALGDRSIDLKSQRQIRMFTSDDGASYTEALNLSSTGGNATFLGTVTVGADGSGKDVTFYSATAGDSFAWDASEEKLTITGTNGQTALDVADGNLVVADNVDIEGDIDVNGTTNLDAVDIDGNVQLDGTFTVGTDGSGQDVTFYSATSGDSFVWDASEEKLTITGTDGAVALDVADGLVKVQESLSITNGSGSFYVWSDDPFGSNYEVLRIDKPSGSNGRISVYKGGTGTYRGLDFETGAATRMTIDSAGKVGIGGTPSYALDVHANLDGNVARFYNDGNDGNRDVLLLQGGADSAGFNTRFITFLDGDGGTVGCLQGASGTSNGGLALNITPDTNDLVVDSNGNVGIGGTPTDNLHIFKKTIRVAADTPEFVLEDTSAFSAGTGPSIYLQGKQTGEGLQTFAEIQAVSTSSVNEGTLIFKTRTGGSTTEKMRIDTSGNVGIGGTPSYQLHTTGTVRHEASAFVLNLYDSQTYSAGSSGARVRLQGKDSAGNEKNLVDLIGTSRGANQGEFQVKVRNSSGNYTEYLRIEDDGASTIGVHDATANSFGIGSNPTISAYTTKLDIGNGNTAVSQIRLKDNEATDGFYIESNSNFAIGYNTTDTINITQAGVVQLDQGQLKFPATQNASADANTLDDYEEGTWTPTIKAYGDSSKAMTMDSGSTGTYTKIGQLVTLTIYVATTANGGVDSNLHLALYDLPFTISNGGSGMESRSGLAGVNPYGLAVTAGHTIGGFGIGNTTKCYLTEFNASLGYIALLRDKWTADGQMICSYSYKVA